jgi:hypothetical protein
LREKKIMGSNELIAYKIVKEKQKKKRISKKKPKRSRSKNPVNISI